MPSNSASLAYNEIDSVSSKGAPVRMQNADQSQLEELIQSLNLLLSEMAELETSGLIGATEVHTDHRASARNLLDYLALRRHDIRPLQSKLARLGLSSLGRTEPHVLSSLHAVLNVLHKLAGSDPITPTSKGALQLGQGITLLEKNTEALLGESPAARHVRIMVTMPPEAARIFLQPCVSSAIFCGACSLTTRKRIRCCESCTWPSLFTLAHDYWY